MELNELTSTNNPASTEEVFDDLLQKQEAAQGQDQPEPEQLEGAEEAKEETKQEATNDDEDKGEKPKSKADDDVDSEDESGEESGDSTDEDAESEDDEISRFSSIEEIAEAADTPVELLLAEVELYKDADGNPVTLEEAKKATLRESDYHRKLSEIDKQSKEAEQQIAERRQNYETNIAQSNQLLNIMAEEYTRDLNSVNFDQLRDEDPAEFAAKVAEFNTRRETLEGLAENTANMRKQSEYEQQTQYTQQIKEYKLAQEQRLFELKPEYKADPTARKQFETEAGEYLKSLGTFEDHEIDIQDARFYQILEDAMKGRGLKAAKKTVIKQKLSKAPKVLRPGKQAQKGELKTNKRKASLARTKKEGTQEALADHFNELLSDDPAFN